MLIILSGVAGAGKDTVKKRLMEIDNNITTLPSFTDRKPRPTDTIGETYEFVTTEEFENMIKNNELYEYSVHHDHYYGTSKKLLSEKLNQSKIIVKDIDVNGTENLVKLLKNDVKIVTIFLRVGKEELRKRLEAREDGLDEKDILLRLDRFEFEESKISNYDYIIKNDTLNKTVDIIQNIIENEMK